MPSFSVKPEEVLVEKQDVAETLEERLTSVPFQNKDGKLVFVTQTKTNGQMVDFELTDGSSFSLLIREKQKG